MMMQSRSKMKTVHAKVVEFIMSFGGTNEYCGSSNVYDALSDIDSQKLWDVLFLLNERQVIFWCSKGWRVRDA